MTRTKIDGMTTISADIDGPYIGSLMFRVGRIDERIATSGLTHLVEHLAIYALGPIDVVHNAFVDAMRTVFWARGARDEVIAFLSAVASSLQALPLDRLDAERRVLRAEGEQRSSSIHTRMMALRYGHRGPGLLDVEEFGLANADPFALRAWGRYQFVRENAVAVFSGDPPKDSVMALPHGDRRPVPTVDAIRHTPVLVRLEGDGIAVGMVTRRTTAAVASLMIAARRLQGRLRRDEGLVYDVDTHYEPLGPDLAQMSIFLRAEADLLQRVAQAMADVMSNLAASGPAQDEVDRFRSQRIDDLDDPAQAFAQLDQIGVAELLGDHDWTVAARRAEVSALTPGSVQDAFATAYATRIVVAPPGIEILGVPEAPPPARPASPIWTRTSLIDPKRTLSFDGSTLFYASPGWSASIRFDEIELVRFADEGRALYGVDGQVLWVARAEWPDGDPLIAQIDATSTPEIYVALPRLPHDPSAPDGLRAGVLSGTDWMWSDPTSI